MKKLLSILAAIGLTTTASTAVVACGTVTKVKENNGSFTVSWKVKLSDATNPLVSADFYFNSVDVSGTGDFGNSGDNTGIVDNNDQLMNFLSVGSVDGGYQTLTFSCKSKDINDVLKNYFKEAPKNELGPIDMTVKHTVTMSLVISDDSKDKIKGTFNKAFSFETEAEPKNS